MYLVSGFRHTTDAWWKTQIFSVSGGVHLRSSQPLSRYHQHFHVLTGHHRQ